MGQKCLTVRARRGTLKSKPWERVRSQSAYFDRRNTTAKNIGVEDCGPFFLLSEMPKALDELAHCGSAIFIPPFPLTFQPPQTLAALQIYMMVSLPFAYSVPFVYIAFLLLVCWKNSCSSFKTLFEAFTDIPSPLVDIVNHLLLCMTSVLCNECSTCSCDYMLTCLCFL